MKLKILILPGDGIGPEVTLEAVRVLEHVAAKWGHQIERSEGLLGGVAIHETGGPFPDETRTLALAADATLLGAVGLPEFDEPHAARTARERLARNSQGARRLRQTCAPIIAYESLLPSSPLKDEIVRGTDMLIVRELTAGLYFGSPRGIEERDGERVAVNSMVYRESEVRRVARVAFSLAQKRRGKVTSVDKANVLENSQLWRQVIVEVAQEFPDVELDHILVDNCAMQLVLNPTRFDVVVTENLFGDILSDEGAVLAGSIGMLPSASIGDQLPNGVWRGLYEPVHGSAPDIAGQNKANPLAAIGSAAAMLSYSFGLKEEAEAVDAAIGKVLAEGPLTADLTRGGGEAATTEQVGRAVRDAIG